MKSLQWVFDGDGVLSADELGALEILSAWPINDEIEKDLKNQETRTSIDQEILKYLKYDTSPMESKNYVYGLYCDVLEKVWEKTLPMNEFIAQTSELLVDILGEKDDYFPTNITLLEWLKA